MDDAFGNVPAGKHVPALHHQLQKRAPEPKDIVVKQALLLLFYPGVHQGRELIVLVQPHQQPLGAKILFQFSFDVISNDAH